MKKLSQEELDVLQAANASLDLETVDDDAMGLHMVLRPPGRLEWKQFRAAVTANPATTYDEQWKLIDTLRIYPTAGEFSAFIDTKPAAVATIMGEVNEMAGYSNAVSRKKLRRT